MTGDEYAVWLEDYQKQVNEAVAEGTAEAMSKAEDACKDISPVQTGRLRDGWTHDETSVSNDVPYAAIVMPNVWSNIDVDALVTEAIEQRVKDIK